MTVRPDVWAAPAAGATYERGRPDYPADAVDFLAAELSLGRDSLVVDLGAGTGKLTRLLAAGAGSVVAVEPMAGMRQQLRVAAPAAFVVGARAEAIPLASGSVSVVTAAQAFHWFQADAALIEIHRVLRPGGALGLIWNKRDESVPWVARMSEILDEYEKLAPREDASAWLRAFDGLDLFTPLRTRTFRHEQRLASLTDRVASMSFVLTLPPEARATLLAEIADLVAGQGGDIRLPYVTHVYWCEKY